MKNLGQMSELYLKIDVRLLFCIFENFRRECLKIYKLEPCYSVTLLSYIWNAILRYTQVLIKFIKDLDMLSLINKRNTEEFSSSVQKYCKTVTMNLLQITIQIYQPLT